MPRWQQRVRAVLLVVASRAALLTRGLEEHTFFVGSECTKAVATKLPSGEWQCGDRGVALPPPVIVVGSDGSGTRVVAKALALSGVTMLVERGLYSQMDIDGSAANVHFTDTIASVLDAAHSPVYNLSALPAAVRVSADALVHPFAAMVTRCACAAGGGPFAIKKPDLLDLVPSLLETWPRMRLVHVVRDGRDMVRRL